MATVQDLYTELGKLRGLNFGELRHLARTMQAAEILPKAGRHQRRVAPHITPRDVAAFLIGLGLSRSSGSRVPMELRRRFNRVKKLVTEHKDGTRSTFLDDLVEWIDRYRDGAWVRDPDREWGVSSIVFVNDDRSPTVWIEELNVKWGDDNGIPLPRRTPYVLPGRLEPADDETLQGEEVLFADAYFLGGSIFFRLREILGPLEEPAATTEAAAS